jgi:ABC-type transporter Mla subunit MlaD
MTYDLRSTRRLLLLPIAILVLSLGVVACGGDNGTSTSDKNKYVDQVNAAQQEFSKGFQKLNFAGGSPSDAKQSLDGLNTVLAKVVSDLGNIKPPDEVKTAHDKLVASVRDFQKVLSENKDAIASGDAQAAQKFSTAASQFGSEFDATVNQINTKLRQ